ncbi:MAG: DNA polymerase IV [Nitrospirota bacterium]
MPRAILHIDMDAFFASVEQRVNPALRGKPVAVCGANSRTVILTASYEARAFGVKTGMRVGEAKACCPTLILVHSHHERYTDVCRRLVKIFQDYTPAVELFSIDEAFLDVTGSLALFGGGEPIARAIKQRIGRELGLTASIGIAPNKLLAKLASGMNKPDGLVSVTSSDVPALLEALPVQELCGIGPALTRRLAGLGMTTCGQLGRAPVSWLVSQFGIIGRTLSAMGRGEDDAPVLATATEQEPEPKSVGHSMTLERDIRNKDQAEIVLLQLAGMVGRRLRKAGLSGRVITVTYRYSDFSTHTHQQTLDRSINDDSAIYQAACALFRQVSLAQPVRLLGVSVLSLEPSSGQLSLFDAPARRQRLMAALDAVNDRHGEWTLLWGSLLQRDHHRAIISPAWRPNGVRDYC